MVLRNEPMIEIRIRQMKIDDMKEILSIASDPSLTPWTENMFMRELQLSLSHNLVAVVKENKSDQVAGFITFWIIANEFQLHNIAVRWNFRRKGIATRLFLAMIQEALDQGAYTGTLEVRNSNEAARKMYEKFGCRVTTVRPSYYSETKENALIMAVKLKEGLEVLHHE